MTLFFGIKISIKKWKKLAFRNNLKIDFLFFFDNIYQTRKFACF